MVTHMHYIACTCAVHVTQVAAGLRVVKELLASFIVGLWYDEDTLTQQTYRYSMAIQRVGMTTAHAQLVCDNTMEYRGISHGS